MKSARHTAILELIEANDIRTQEQIADALEQTGVIVTQATISRDIKELRLIKIMTGDGGYKYATVDKAEKGVTERMIKIFKETAVSVDSADNLVVVKTLTGSAGAACEAVDAMKWPGIMGTIAGDNTMLVIAKTAEAAERIINHFKALLSN